MMSECGIAGPAAAVAWSGRALTAAGPGLSQACFGAAALLGIALCSCLMVSPPGTTWFNFLISTVLVLAIYPGYSVHYSRQAKAPAS